MPRYAAIDIGSNSIRMLAAEVVGGSPIKTLVSSRQVTRLGEGVFRTGRISQGAMDLSCNVLAQMSAEYQRVGVIGVRALGTSALRDAGPFAGFDVAGARILPASFHARSGAQAKDPRHRTQAR